MPFFINFLKLLKWKHNLQWFWKLKNLAILKFVFILIYSNNLQ